jgi:hypothetical protein
MAQICTWKKEQLLRGPAARRFELSKRCFHVSLLMCCLSTPIALSMLRFWFAASCMELKRMLAVFTCTLDGVTITLVFAEISLLQARVRGQAESKTPTVLFTGLSVLSAVLNVISKCEGFIFRAVSGAVVSLQVRTYQFYHSY